MDNSTETRRIYHAQHQRIVADPKAMERFILMFSEDYFGVPGGFFQGKRILDAGCGDTVKLLIAMHRMGARNLHGFDLGDDFIPTAHRSLIAHGIDPNAVALKSGSLLEIPFPDDSFDFVACHGVLLHLNSLEEVELAFQELARVTRPGGLLYTVFGVVGGLFEDCIFPAIRDYYAKTPEFKMFIDNISPEDFSKAATLVEDREGVSIDRDLFDTDLCVTIQNILQAPIRLKIDEAMIRRMYDKQFSEPRRLRRYVKRNNIRRFFAPFHYEYHENISKLIYGSGNLEFIATKTS